MCVVVTTTPTGMYGRFIQQGKNKYIFKCVTTFYIVSQLVGIIEAEAATTTRTVAAAAARARQLKSTKRNSLNRTLTAPF